MKRAMVTFTILGLCCILLGAGTPPTTKAPAPQAAGLADGKVQRPPIAVPSGEGSALIDYSTGNGAIPRGVGPGMQAGADHVVGLQCVPGCVSEAASWKWPHGGCPANTNITGPIGLGMLYARSLTGDPDHLTSATRAGEFMRECVKFGNDTPAFATFDPYFLMNLGGIYSTHAEVGFFDALTAGTYRVPNEDTAGYIARVQAGRAGTYINLLPWEFSTLVTTAATIGNDASGPSDTVSQRVRFSDAVLAGLNTLDSTKTSDLLGLAGAVRGLALDGTIGFPPIDSPAHSSIDGMATLCELADLLAAYQNSDGSWSWSSTLQNPVDPTDKDTQTTAYAVMALLAADVYCADYSTQIAKGRDFLRSMQLPDGGFQSYPGGGENVEVEGEALNALAPDPCTQNKLVFEVPTASLCVKSGETVTVELWQHNMQQATRGFQAWGQFDNGMMAFVSGSGTYTATPYPLAVITPIVASGNNIDMAAGVNFGDPAVLTPDAKLVTLTFTAGGTEGPTTVSFRYRNPPSRFTMDGNELTACLVQSPTILIDNTAPVITCPANATVECDDLHVYPNPLPIVTGSATATDNLDDAPLLITYTDVWTPNPGCTYTGTITRTWKAEDCAGNVSLPCQQTITVNDVTKPTVTKGTIAACYLDVASAEATAIAATSATDNCESDLQLTKTASTVGTCSAVVTVRVTDCADNFDEVTYNTRIDNTLPVISGTVAAGSLDASCGATVAVNVTVTDNCGILDSAVTYSMATTSGSLNYTGLTKVQTDSQTVTISGNAILTAVTDCTATVGITVNGADECGNAAGTFNTSGAWSDTTVPTITCPANVTTNADAGLCTAKLAQIFDFETIDPPYYDYYADPDCLAERVSFLGSYRAHFKLNADSGYARVRAPITAIPALTVGNVSAMFNAYIVPGSMANLGPYVMLDIDENDDGVMEELIIAFVRGASPITQGCWYTDGLNGATVVHVAGARTGLTPTEFSPSAGGGLMSALRSRTFSGSKTWGDLRVLNVRVGTGLWPGSTYFECYVDDIIVAKYLELPPSASDNCAAPVVTGVRNDSLALDAPYPASTTIAWTASDCCTNSATCNQTVTVSAFNEMLVSVELSPTMVVGSITRCITFDLWKCPGTTPAATVSEVLTFTKAATPAGSPMVASNALVLVPCASGPYDCITARDKLHTLRRTATPTIVGTQWVVNFTGAAQLIGGNLNDDYWIDILDFGVYSWKYGKYYYNGAEVVVPPSPYNGNTTCSTPRPHADISGNGIVGTEDFTFIQINFLKGSEVNCCGAPGFRDGEAGNGPITSISVAQLRQMGLKHLAAGDLNNDGVLDQADVAAFLMGARPKPQPDQEEAEAIPLDGPPTNQLRPAPKH
jgi:hypothetical protein